MCFLFLLPTDDPLKPASSVVPGMVELGQKSMQKLPITERGNLQFRAAAYNIYNHASFSCVGDGV
jgi:hypothetical protein